MAYAALLGRSEAALDGTRTLAVGDFFGDISLIDGRPRSATIVAGEKPGARFIGAADIAPPSKQQPEFNPPIAAIAVQANIRTRMDTS